jgi:hypothetical protein
VAFVLPLVPLLGSALGASAATATAAGVSAIGTGVSMLGTGAAALASHNSAEFQAKLAKTQGRQAQEQASVKAGEVARDTKQRSAALRAGALQGGFEVAGSMSDLLYQSERQGELDYLTAVYDGSVQATGLRATAKNYKRTASNALIGGALGMGAQALGGASNILGMKSASINVSGT